jgi:hypothetical protein
MSIAKRIAAKRAEQERSFVDVEEWGEADQPLRLFFGPVTARDIEKVQRKHPKFMSDTSMAAMIEMMVLKCEDESGEKAFTLEDKPILMGEPVGVIAKVFGAVFAADSVEEHEKN